MTSYKRNKYKAKKIIVDGEVFDSKKEARRWQELKMLERAGEIHDLCRQVVYELIPNQYVPAGGVYTKGKKKGYPKMKLAERSCSYIADFVYEDNAENIIVEDTKGIRTKDYIIKRKLMLYVHGIRIQEI